ncbi:hypothetical protein IWX91DRAFT_132620 [Phyllosticta citricarpa]
MYQATFPAFAGYGAASLYLPVETESECTFRQLPTLQLNPHYMPNDEKIASPIPQNGLDDGAVSMIEPRFRYAHHDPSFHEERGSLGSQTLLPHPHRVFPLSHSEDIFSDPIARFYRDADGPWSSVEANIIQSASLPSTIGPTGDAGEPESRFQALSDVSAVSETSAWAQPAVFALSKGSNHGAEVAKNAASFQGGKRTAACRECDGTGEGEDENAKMPTITTPAAARRPSKLFHCRTCHRNFKCASDLKKDRRKHCKPFTCSVPGCVRGKTLGFTTVNDLNRHKKSVHPEEMMMMAAANTTFSSSSTTTTTTTTTSYSSSTTSSSTPTATNASTTTEPMEMATQTKIGGDMQTQTKTKNIMPTTPSFRCVGRGCARSAKIWPRRDNFTQHVRRVHGEEGCAEIVRRSLFYPNGAPPVDEVSPARGASLIGSSMKRKSGGKGKRSKI